MIVEHAIEIPHWIKSLIDNIVDCMTPFGFIGPLGYRYWEPDNSENLHAGVWQIVVYPVPNEVCGSNSTDGALFVSGFRFDIGKLIECMSSTSSIVWNSPANYTCRLDGPEISIGGRYAGHNVMVRLFNLPPPDEQPAYAFDPKTGRATELFEE